jgi:hypothetical protein
MTAQPAAPVSSSTPSSSGQSLGRAVVFGIVGLVAAALGHFTINMVGEVFHLPPEIAKLGIGQIPGDADQKKIAAANLVNQYRHFALWMALAGGLAGLLLCVTQAVIAGASARTKAIGAVVGLLLGGVGGAIAGPLSLSMDIAFHKSLVVDGQLNVPETKVMLLHGTTWLIIGATIGLAVSIVASAKPRDLVVGTLTAGIASMLGGVLYPILIVFVDPVADPSFPMPSTVTGQLLWMGVPLLLAGLVLGRRHWSAGVPAPAAA